MKRYLQAFIMLAVLFWHGMLLAATGNVILFIGDGMGFEQVRAARLYLGQPLLFDEFSYQGRVHTGSADDAVTDSAAAATAMATGLKVANDVISMAIPGDRSELTTLLEEASAEGRTTGLVTTAYLTHATPAAFGAHEASRDNLADIAVDYLVQTRPNVLFGGGGKGLSAQAAQAAGYAVATNKDGFAALDTARPRLSAQFGSGHMPFKYNYLDGDYPYPDLADMTRKALDALANDPDGFFLMVEGGRIDHACHRNQVERAIHETLDFSRAVGVALHWAEGRTDTLIVVTADHETGGLAVTRDNGAGNYPTVTWSTFEHTDSEVPVYAWGAGARLVSGSIDNTRIFDICRNGGRQPVQADNSLRGESTP